MPAELVPAKAGSGHPEDMGLSSGAWIPAFAGMTKLGYLATGASHALTSLMFETVPVLSWTRVNLNLAKDI